MIKIVLKVGLFSKKHFQGYILSENEVVKVLTGFDKFATELKCENHEGLNLISNKIWGT